MILKEIVCRVVGEILCLSYFVLLQFEPAAAQHCGEDAARQAQFLHQRAEHAGAYHQLRAQETGQDQHPTSGRHLHPAPQR